MPWTSYNSFTEVPYRDEKGIYEQAVDRPLPHQGTNARWISSNPFVEEIPRQAGRAALLEAA